MIHATPQLAAALAVAAATYLGCLRLGASLQLVPPPRLQLGGWPFLALVAGALLGTFALSWPLVGLATAVGALNGALYVGIIHLAWRRLLK